MTTQGRFFEIKSPSPADLMKVIRRNPGLTFFPGFPHPLVAAANDDAARFFDRWLSGRRSLEVTRHSTIPHDWQPTGGDLVHLKLLLNEER